MKKLKCDLNHQLEEIMQKYGIRQMGESYYDMILYHIGDILKKTCDGKRIVIRGCGRHTRHLLEVMPFSPNIIAFSDRKSSDNMFYKWNEKEYPVLPMERLAEVSADVVLISSYTYRKEIREELGQHCKHICIIDIYDELIKRNFNLQEPFYNNTQKTYDNILLERIAYKNAENREEEEKHLRNMIYYSLRIRDFLNAFSYLEDYVNNDYRDSNRYQEFYERLKEFLEKIRGKFQERTERDIIIVWNDQLGYNELSYVPFIRQSAETGISFQNAFTTVPFTFGTFWAMFEKQLSVEDRIYFVKHDKIGENNRIIRMLEQKGYGFYYIGDGPTAKYFEEPYRKGYPSYDSSCVRCFDMLETLLNAETKMCIMLHGLVETHNPYLSGELEHAQWYEWPYRDTSLEPVIEQIELSARYWDRELAFYLEILHANSSRILMSDHGKRYLNEPIYNDLANHVIFIMQDKRVKATKENRMFSLINLEQAIDYLSDEILSDEKYKNIFSDVIRQQEVGIFNQTAIRYYMENGNQEALMPYRAVRGIEDKYILLSSGKEYYFRMPDEEQNEIDNPLYQKRIEELRKLAGNVFFNRVEYEMELQRFRRQYETHI